MFLAVYGERNAWNTARKKVWEDDPKLPDGFEWRKKFLYDEPGRIITSQGSFYMREEATEIQGFLVRDDKLEQLAWVSYARKRRRR